jgi:methyl-accepting chemotaxis protein
MSEEAFRWVLAVGAGIATLCVIAMAAAAVALYKVASKVEGHIDDVKTRALPIMDSVRRVAEDNAPGLTAITGSAAEIAANAKAISVIAKDQACRFGEVGRDIADRTRAQVARVDAAVDDTVEQVHHAGDNVKAAVMKPVREASAVLAGVRAAVVTLVDGRRPTVDHITQDEEMFI